MRKHLLLLLASFVVTFSAFAQSLPPNIDFETGTYSNWTYYTGTCCPISGGTATAPVPGRHMLMTGSGTDPYGGFPVVAPYGGSYSFKLGNDTGTSQSEHVRYYVHIPAGTSTYGLVMHYAIVFEDPGHLPGDQPRFEFHAYDSATGMYIPCGMYNYVASAALPGFSHGPSDIIYRPWTIGMLNMNGMSGRTVVVDFATGDCSLGGHFSYGYVDISQGLFNTSKTIPCGSLDTLTAPPGYTTYHWYDSATFATSYGTTQTIVIPGPSSPVATYAVVLNGAGCSDTLYTRVNVALPCPTLGIHSHVVSNDAVTLFPSPAAGELTILLNGAWYDGIIVSDQFGRSVINKEITSTEMNLDISALSPGVYFVQFHGPNGNDVRRFVKM